MFYRIIIRLYPIDNKHHHLPHIHARHAESEAPVDAVDGEPSRKPLRLVQAWIERHRARNSADGTAAIG